MASPSESGSRGNLDISLKCIPKSPSVSEWLAMVDEARVALYGSPAEPSADLGRAAAVLIQAHLRHRAPTAAIWQQLHTADWTEAIRAVEQLSPPVRWAVGAAAGAWFARNGNEAGFEAATRILKAFRFPVTFHEEVAHGALLTCIEYRPSLLGELMRNGALKSLTPLEYLARTRSAAQVAEVFQGAEEACSNCEPEISVRRAIWGTRRWDVALACLPLVKHDIIIRRTRDAHTQTAAKRRDGLRWAAARALAKDGRLQQATELLLESEDRERGAYEAVDLLCDFDSPDVAFDLWKGSAYCRADSFLARDIALAFAKQGRVGNALEVAAQAGGTKSDRSEIVVSALTQALEGGAVNEVAGALDQVSSKRDRAKLEQLVARAGGALEPKELRAQAEMLAVRATTPQLAAAAATQIASLLPDTKVPDAIFIRAALVRVLAKAELHEAIDEHLSAALAGVRGVSRRKVRIEAAAAVFAATVASRRFADGLALLEHVTEDFNDHDEMREFLFDVVETCKDAGVIEQLKATLPAGSDSWVVEQFNEILTWQGVSEGKVDQLVKKAMKRPREADRNRALNEIIDDLRARKQYPEALAVLRRMQEPHAASTDRISLARGAAEGGFPRVAEEILDIVESGWRAKAEGRAPQETASSGNQLWQDIKDQALKKAQVENPALVALLGELSEMDGLDEPSRDRRTWQQVREQAFEVRSAFGLAHGDEDTLVSVAEGMTVLSDKVLWKAAEKWLMTMSLDFTPDAKQCGSTLGERIAALTAMGHWPKAFAILKRILPVSDGAPRSWQKDRASTACHLLLTAPLDIIRAHASVFSDHLELAWIYTAALAVRGGEERKSGPVQRPPKPGGNKSEFLTLLQESGQLLQTVPR